MGRRTGTADLPLHYGSVPRWLSEGMARLAGIIVEAIILHYGRAELLRRLARPFWFQSFGALKGQDRHSSGITTSTVWALKRALSQTQWLLRELDRASKDLDHAGEASFAEVVAKERMMSPALGGRTAGSADTVAPSAEKIVQR